MPPWRLWTNRAVVSDLARLRISLPLHIAAGASSGWMQFDATLHALPCPIHPIPHTASLGAPRCGCKVYVKGT